MSTEYLNNYLIVGVLAGVAVLIGVFPLILAKIVAPKKPGESKQSQYECGLKAEGDPWVQFRAEYYIYALLFVIFDVEVVFIYPWALVWKALGPIALIEMALFLGILSVGLVYAWKKGVLEWH